MVSITLIPTIKQFLAVCNFYKEWFSTKPIQPIPTIKSPPSKVFQKSFNCYSLLPIKAKINNYTVLKKSTLLSCMLVSLGKERIDRCFTSERPIGLFLYGQMCVYVYVEYSELLPDTQVARHQTAPRLIYIQ